jgi:peptidoglycan hydrolase-like protein with peptidoglycan-binding domain
LALQAWTGISRRPIDSVAIATAVAASAIIVVNAIFLQSSMRVAPYFDAAKQPSPKSDSLKPLVTGGPAQPIAPPAAVQPVVARRGDAIAELIGPSPRIAAVQRALSNYGYGQLKPTGTLDDATRAAIQKFERERNLPSTGRVSDRLIKELAGMTGHPIE